MMRIKKLSLTAVCVLLIAVSFVTSAFANWYDDIRPGCTWVEIEGEDFVADTFCGVDALYNENDAYYQCNEVIMRFYREAFGLDILAYSNTGPVMLTDGYDLVETSSPKKGDIIYVTAEMRGSATDHWAIVKDYGNGYITMFEQNAVWDGKAARNRQIKYPSDSYYIFTPVSLGDYPDPVLKGEERETTASSTTKTETTVTTKPVTTKVSTTKAETSAAVSTTVAETTVITQTAETTTQAATTVKAVQGNTEISTTSPDESKTEKKNGFVIPVVGVCAALAVIIVAAVIVIKKKK
jgi:hypothetical protein